MLRFDDEVFRFAVARVFSIRREGRGRSSTSLTLVLRIFRFVGDVGPARPQERMIAFSSSSLRSFCAAGIPIFSAKSFNCSRYQ